VHGRWFVPLAVSAAGCASQSLHPSTNLWGAEAPVTVGTTLTVAAGWSEVCTEGWLDKNGPRDAECHPKPVQVEVACEGPCKIENGEAVKRDETAAMVNIIALDRGTISIHAKNRRVGSSAAESKDFTVNVVAPDHLALECLHPKDTSAHEFVPCGPEGVSAQTPLVRPRIYVGDREVDSVFLTVNSIVTPVEPRRGLTEVSLADLFPDARQGGGIAAGTYTVTLSLAGVTEHFQVVAR
jgi:hypothetical protein